MKKIVSFIIALIIVISGLSTVQAVEVGCCEIRNVPDNGIIIFENKTSEECEYVKNINKHSIFYDDKRASEDKKSCVSGLGTSPTPTGPSTMTAPLLQVSIPGFEGFSDVQCDEEADTPCEIPWLSQYIKAIYNYGLLILGILAVIMMMIGGFMRVTAAGNREQINQGNGYLKGAILGAVLAFCSYMILFLVNPNLVIWRPIAVSYIAHIDLPEIDLSKSAEELGISQTELNTLRGQNPYQDGCGNIQRCEQYGNTQPPGLVKVAPEYGNVYLKPEVYEAFKRALNCVDPGKIKFTITDGWRSAAAQIDVKRRKPTLAATPCCSNHGGGLAMDLAVGGGGQMTWSYNDSSGLTRCMNQNGIHAELKSKPNEPWHWSPTGR